MIDFYEDDEPVEKVAEAFDSGEKIVTAPPFSRAHNELFQRLVAEKVIIVRKFTDEPRDFNFKDIGGL